jgi:hypothetical protein
MSTATPIETSSGITLPTAIASPSSTLVDSSSPNTITAPLPSGVPTLTSTSVVMAEPLWSTTEVETAHELFLLILLPNDPTSPQSVYGYDYRTFIYNLDIGELKTRDIDLAETGWHLGISGLNYALGEARQPAQYDPTTGEIYLAVQRGTTQIGDVKPQGSLPDAPFEFAIYRTRFDPQTELVQVYQSSSHGFYYFAFFLEIGVFLFENEGYSLDGSMQPTLNKLDLSDGSVTILATFIGDKGGRKIDRISNLGVTPQGDRIYLVFHYENPYDCSDEYAQIVTVDLNNRQRDAREIVFGEGFPGDVASFSGEALSRGQTVRLQPPESAEELVSWSPTARYVAMEGKSVCSFLTFKRR